MLDVEISLRLAFAIGWPYEKVHIVKGVVQVPWRTATRLTRAFNYKDSDVIWAIAEHYDAFPTLAVDKKYPKGSWCAMVGTRRELVRYADSSKKAVALSIIAHDEYLKRLTRRRTRTTKSAV